jgi:hypothetical protein
LRFRRHEWIGQNFCHVLGYGHNAAPANSEWQEEPEAEFVAPMAPFPSNMAPRGYFSQGMVMALHIGLHRERQLAGIIGYSGRLIAAHLLVEECARARRCSMTTPEKKSAKPSGKAEKQPQELDLIAYLPCVKSPKSRVAAGTFGR